ncbi:MAG: class I SAM-dependent methyltransferase, partial [Anaerolineae bacterium]
MYDLDTHVAEIYDQLTTETADIAMVRRLLGGRTGLRILEPLCGTGRILIPLALDGHVVVGLERADGMLARARAKIGALPPEVEARITLRQAD